MKVTAARPRLSGKSRVGFGLLVRLAVPALAFGYLAQKVDAGAVWDAICRVSPYAITASLSWLAVGVMLGMVRWRALMLASGALSLPSWGRSLRLYLTGMFFNLLPGAVGGDVYRGYATRDCFIEAKAARSIGVVLVERILGLAGLFLVAAVAALVSPFDGVSVLLYAAAGLLTAAIAISALAWGRRLHGLLPAAAARWLASLPVVDRAAPLLVALLLSVATQMVASMNGYVVVENLVPGVSFLGAMAIFPLGTFASYFPFTLAGAGARDATLVVLLAKVGVGRADALATSLVMLFGNVAVSSLGGIAQLSSRANPIGGGSATEHT